MIVKEYKDALKKTVSLLDENDDLRLYQPYIAYPGEVLERNVDTNPYYLDVFGPVVHETMTNHAQINEEVINGDKLFLVVETVIPYKDAKGKEQFPSEIPVITNEDAVIGYRFINVATEFLEVKEVNILGVRFDKFTIKDINEGTGEATSFDIKYSVVDGSDNPLSDWDLNTDNK